MKGEIIHAKSSYSIRNIILSILYAKDENAVKGLNGVNHDSLKVLFNASKVKVDFDSETITINDIEKAIEDLGYPVVKSKVKSA